MFILHYVRVTIEMRSINVSENKIYKKFILCLLLSLFATLFFVAGLNYFVNPYNIFKVKTCGLTYLKPVAKIQERVTKFISFKLDKRKIDTVFLGTSRADYAIDKDYFKKITGKEAENMAMGGMVIEEYREVLDMILKIHPEIKNVYVSADFIMFGGDKVFDEKSKAKITTSAKLTTQEICTAFLSVTGVRDSFWTLIKNALGIKTQMYTPEGLRYMTPNPKIQEAFAYSVAEYIYKYRNFKYNPEKLTVLKELKEYCEKRKIKFYVFVMPTHVLDMQLMEEEGVYDDFLHWKADLSQIITFHDFQYPCAITNEKIDENMKYFVEISHASPLTGRLILGEIIKDDKTFGRIYTPEYAFVFNESDRGELNMLADEEVERTKFLEEIRRNNAI